jgi:hypothetical protein
LTYGALPAVCIGITGKQKLKMAAPKPEILAPQFIDMMAERLQWAYFSGDGQVKETEFNHVPRERK